MDASTRSGALAGRLADALAQGLPTVLDAGALDLVSTAGGSAVITPHFRELARLLSAQGETVSPADIADMPAHWAGTAADRLGVVVLLKGSTTYVASPDGEGIRVAAGPAWVATAGAGDVLGGVLGALIASHSDRILASPAVLGEIAAAAAHLHGRAGERASAGGPVVALDIAEALPATIASLLG
jgi:NAD(P)H-hydrate repair Nnr-like enzyme with NAD(P)H-hydrate dehydratase domain